MKLPLVTAALLGLSLPLAVEAGAQTLQPGMRTVIQRGGPEGLPLVPAHPDDLDDDRLQPGMRTMIQRGGTEGVLLGALLPVGIDGPAYDAPPEFVRRHRPREVVRVRN